MQTSSFKCISIALLMLQAMSTVVAEPLFSESFAESLGQCTVVDANADGNTWVWNDGAASVRYNRQIKMDDWLFTPVVALEAGEAYKVTLDAYGINSLPERLEIKYGQSAQVAAMTATLIPATVVTATAQSPCKLEAYIVPEADSEISLGIHGISDPTAAYLFVDNIRIAADPLASLPSAVTDLTASTDVEANSVQLSFNAPVTDLASRALQSLLRIDIYRDGDRVEYIDNPEPGHTYTYTDYPNRVADHTYKVVAVNATGVGREAAITVYSGVDYPLAPEWIKLSETSTPGEIAIEWAPVTSDLSGSALPASAVTYSLHRITATGLSIEVRNLTSTTHTLTAVASDRQQFVGFAVKAHTARGESDATRSEFVAAGIPYQGIEESFTGGNYKYSWDLSQTSGGNWNIISRQDGIDPVDYDGGMLCMTGLGMGNKATIGSAKISLEGMTHPALTLYTHRHSSDHINLIQIYAGSVGGDYTLIKATTPSELTEYSSGWGKLIVPLDQYAGNEVQLRLTATSISHTTTLIDNIKVASLAENDLRLMSLKSQANVAAGETFDVNVSVVNDGALPAKDWAVGIYNTSGLMLAQADGPLLQPGATVQVVLPVEMSILATEPMEITASILFDNDADMSNNTSAHAIAVTPGHTDLPFVESLTALGGEGAIHLQWTEPAFATGDASQVTVDFEDGESMAQNYSDWTFVDIDQSASGSIRGIAIPGVTAGQTAMSFFVLDQTKVTISNGPTAHSGEKMLASLYRKDDGTVDDWAISPTLDAAAQTVSFYARSYDAMCPEKIEILISSIDTTDPSMFTTLVAPTVVPKEWTLYSASLPEGTRRVAIRSCAKGSYMLMIDDVTLTKAAVNDRDNFIGYNLYRDGECLNSSALTATEFTDPVGDSDLHAYHVAAIYHSGQSRPSPMATAQIQSSGIANVETPAVSVTVTGQIVTVKGLKPSERVYIFAIDGTVAGAHTGSFSQSLATGIYIIHTPALTRKILVGVQ